MTELVHTPACLHRIKSPYHRHEQDIGSAVCKCSCHAAKSNLTAPVRITSAMLEDANVRENILALIKSAMIKQERREADKCLTSNGFTDIPAPDLWDQHVRAADDFRQRIPPRLRAQPPARSLAYPLPPEGLAAPEKAPVRHPADYYTHGLIRFDESPTLRVLISILVGLLCVIPLLSAALLVRCST